MGDIILSGTGSGTQTVNQGTTPWVDNITQFGSNNVVTGTGASGLGIPRVTVSNDSNILVTQSGTWTVTANAGAGTFTISGTVTANQGTSPWVENVSQFGGNAVVTGTGASGVGIPRVTISNDSQVKVWDGTNQAAVTAASALKVDGSAVTQPVSGTVTSNQGTPAVGANAWPTAVTNTADTIVKPGDAVNNAIRVNIVAGAGSGGTAMTDNSAFTPSVTSFTPSGGEVDDVATTNVTENNAGTFRMSTRRELYTQIRDAAGGERGVNISAENRLSDIFLTRTGSVSALNALAATAQVALEGARGVGVIFAAGTLTATIVPELSYDGGTSWVGTSFLNPATGGTSANVKLTNPNPDTSRTIVPQGGATHARVRVSAFTTGTSNATVSATAIDPISIFSNPEGGELPPTVGLIGCAAAEDNSVRSIYASTSGLGAMYVDTRIDATRIYELLIDIRTELRLSNTLAMSVFNMKDDLNSLRRELFSNDLETLDIIN